MTYRTQPTQTLSRELYGSSKHANRKVRPKPPAPPPIRARGLSPQDAKKLPSISAEADKFFKSIMRCEDEDREPDEETHASIQATIAEFKRKAWEIHLAEMREKGVSHVEADDEWA